MLRKVKEDEEWSSVNRDTTL